MGLRQESELRVTEEAAVWLQRLRERDTPATRAEFSEWIRKGATHLEEFLFVQAIWKEMDHVDRGMRDRLWSIENPRSVVDFPTCEPLKLEPGRAKRPVRGWRRPIFASAAAIFAALFGWMLLTYEDFGANTYATTLGEQKSVKLSDGSLIYLNTSSRAIVHLTNTERVIRLTAGEAMFTVAPDSRRPFYVLTDSARVRAIGTQFNVYRNSGTGTRVAVVEGVVQVSSVDGSMPAAAPSVASKVKPDVLPGAAAVMQLTAGDEADVGAGRVVKASKPSVERAVSWRTRKLMFPGNPVREIVEQFNRYNETRIRIDGKDLETRRMSGVFDADDPSPLVKHLARDPTIEVIYGSNEIVIRER